MAKRGMNLRNAIAFARSLGCVVEGVRRTGEIRFRHRSSKNPMRVNGRRKDASQALVHWLSKIVRNTQVTNEANRSAT